MRHVPIRHDRRSRHVRAAVSLVVLLLCTPRIEAQPTRAALLKVLDPLITAEMTATGTPGAAIVFVQDGKVLVDQGYGFADLNRRLRVDPASTLWPAASITKVFTATAVMQLVDSGRVTLEGNLQRYLKTLRVPDTFPTPLTLHHLLSHTTGLDELPGRLVRSPQEIRPVDEFLASRLVRYRDAGTQTAYSSYGIALATVVLQDVTGLTYETYLGENVLRPLGMTRSRVMRRAGDERGLATAYELEDGRATAIDPEWYHTTSTSSLIATTGDVARFMLAHLDDGILDGKRVLSAQSARAMRRQQSTLHPKVPGWGYGWQCDNVGGRLIAEHGGDIGGFAALLTLLPEERAGFFVVHHGEGSDLRFKVKKALLQAFYPPLARSELPRPDRGKRLGLARYAGKYRGNIYCHTCSDPNVQDFEVSVTDDGTLSVFGSRWIMAGEHYFTREDGLSQLGFSVDEKGEITAISAGAWRVGERLGGR